MNRDTTGSIDELSQFAAANEYTMDDALTLIGFGRMHLQILLTSGLLVMAITAESMGMGILAPASQCHFGTDSVGRAIMHASTFLGIICAAYFMGYLCDLIGRRRILLWSSVPCVLTSFLSIFMSSYLGYLCMRFLTGLFLAGPASVGLMYLGEFCSHKQRTIVVNFMAMFNGFGILYCPGIAHFITQGEWYFEVVEGFDLVTWRILGLIYLIPGVCGSILLCFMPESPKFLLASGAHDEALAVLQLMAEVNKSTAFLEANVRHIKPIQPLTTFDRSRIFQQMWQEAHAVFQEPYVKRFVKSCLIMTGLYMVAMGIGIWFTELRNRVLLRYPCPMEEFRLCDRLYIFNHARSEADVICSDSFRGFNDSILLGITFLLSYVVFGLLLLVVPRKQVFCVPLLVSSLCGVALLFVRSATAIRACYIVYLAFPGVVINLLGSSVVDFIPTYLRGKAMCIIAIFGRLGVIFGTVLVGFLVDDHCEWAYAIFACVSLVSAILGYTLKL